MTILCSKGIVRIMKKVSVFIAVVSLFSFFASNALADQSSVAKLYQEGLRAVDKGDVALAEAKFAEVLKLNPKHGNARYQLINLRKNKDGLAGKAQQIHLKSIILKDIDLKGAKFTDAIDYLSSLISEESDKGMNFIIQDPDGKLSDKTVTLSLKKVPASVALEYVLKAAGARANYRKHAIEISPAN